MVVDLCTHFLACTHFLVFDTQVETSIILVTSSRGSCQEQSLDSDRHYMIDFLLPFHNFGCDDLEHSFLIYRGCSSLIRKKLTSNYSVFVHICLQYD